MNYTKTAFSVFVAVVAVVMPFQAFALTATPTDVNAGAAAAITAQQTSPAEGSVFSAAAVQTTVNAGSVTTLTSTQTNPEKGSVTDLNSTPTKPAGGEVVNLTSTQTHSNGGDATTLQSTPTHSNGGDATTLQSTPTNPQVGNEAPKPGTGNGDGAVGGVENKGNTVSSSSSSGGGGSYVISYPGCAFSTDYIKFGATGAEVTKLQNFLKNQGFVVTVTGTYDIQTVDAVKNFQAKYASDILTPWGIDYPTGYAYITTLKKINQISCSTSLSLSADEQAIIAATKAAADRGDVVVSEVIGSNTTGGSTNGTTSTQVAAAGQTEVLGKIWNFIKRIFGR